LTLHYLTINYDTISGKAAFPVRRSRGIALLMALFILVFVFILGLAFRCYCDQNYIFSVETARKTQLYYLAESGIEYCLSQRAAWNNGIPPGADIIQFPSGWVVIKDYIDSGGAVTITSAGMLRHPSETYMGGLGAVTIKATIDSSGAILSWETQ
jgi:hypothetical protein